MIRMKLLNSYILGIKAARERVRICLRETIVETQPQLQPALLSLSAMVSQYFTPRILPLF
jgi:hypothetical protein